MTPTMQWFGQWLFLSIKIKYFWYFCTDCVIYNQKKKKTGRKKLYCCENSCEKNRSIHYLFYNFINWHSHGYGNLLMSNKLRHKKFSEKKKISKKKLLYMKSKEQGRFELL